MVSGSSVLLPPSYAELLKHAQQRCVSVQTHLASFQEKVDAAFLSVTEFINSVGCSPKLDIPEEEMLAALHLLHDTGDIVWFDGVSDVRLLKERLFLDPMLVIEFIRQIVSHKMDANAAVNGYVSHAQLQSLPFWREVSTTTMQQLKELLLHLHLAYSAGKSKRMAWNSDLIVPVYWNRAPEEASDTVKTFPADEDKASGLIALVRWEYSFEPAIPENLFEKLAVATYSPLLQSERRYAGSSFVDKMPSEHSSRIAKEDDAAQNVIASVLSISVAARERTLAWKQLVWYGMNLENLLKTYPGLLVTRCTVNHHGQRFNVDQLLSDQEHLKQLNMCTDQEFLPADVEWYTKKSRYLNPVSKPHSDQIAPSGGTLAAEVARIQQGVEKLATIVENQLNTMERQFQQNAEHIANVANEIQRSQISLITGMKNKAKFPSLWTLEYQGFERGNGIMGSSIVASLQRKVMATVVLKFRSDISGKCYHEPITISAAPAIFSRFGKCLKVGLTLLSAATPEFCGKDVISIITEECKRQLDRSMDFHEILLRTGIDEDPMAGPKDMEKNRELSPNEILALLCCLLRIHNEAFQADDTPQLSGLVSGVVVKTGEYIWASRDEILQRGADIVLALEYAPRGIAANPSSVEQRAAIEVFSTVVEVLSPTETETLQPVMPVPPQHGSRTDPSAELNPQEDGIGAKGVLHAMRRRLSSSKSAVPTTEVQRYMLKIIGAKSLYGNRKQNPYCICRFDTVSGTTLLQIQTSPHPNGGQNPSWRSQFFEVALPIDATHNATITFTIKHGSVLGSSQIAQGSSVFISLQPGQSATQEVCLMKKGKPAGILEFSLEAFA
ncbi:hypothetical protein PHYPSEUDO_000964 [Phytophthora pseudosyringae]|uniref:C2 domain-containing protein n=1 Tax=Phytophthora pseudosyringae TaxID=221518 RepID=A0A8T1VWS5_9STRA|nr:hypothetical protein PHYPSEUDO_000964 [Phytophthora pseudosyringae]